MLLHKPRIPVRELLLYGLLPSWIKVAVYRLRGAKIGAGVSIGFGSLLIGEDIEVGDGTQIGHLTIIRARTIRLGRFVKIGTTTMIDTERVEIDDDAKINEQVFIGGPSLPESSLKVGKRTIIMQMSFINPTKPIVIGDDTGIGGHCLIFTHGSWQPQTDGYPVVFAPVTLGKNVWLPWRVFVMPGVSIGDGATIGAGSLVNKNVPAGSLAAGSPARVLKEKDQYPPQLDDPQRDAMVRGMFDEFFGFLRYHGVDVEVVATRPIHAHLIVHTGRHLRRHHRHFQVIYAGHESPPDLTGIDARTTYCSFHELSADARQKLGAAGAMWVDLSRKQRCGSNDAGEETVLFLSRYGLRFDRVD